MVNSVPIPISSLFIGIHGFLAFLLSYIVVMERTQTRVWHGESEAEVASQPDYLENLSGWAAFVEQVAKKAVTAKTTDDGLLQRKVRAFGNFIEYVPLALLIVVALELMQAPTWLLWLLGSALAIGRVVYAWGVIQTYGPSPGRAIGFFLTWFVYLIGAGACIYYSVMSLI